MLLLLTNRKIVCLNWYTLLWQYSNPVCSVACVFSSLKVKGKGRYSCFWGNPTSELRDVTCHMGSHSVTWHKWMHPA